MTILGIKIEVIIAILFALCILLGLLVFYLYRKITFMSRKYYALTSGQQGADLEHVITTRFKEMDKIKRYIKKIHKEHKEIRLRADSCICKTGVVKYDAFDDLSGNLSFSIALLDRDNNGLVLSSMHTKEGCFTYAKEIIKGKSYINLSDEEKEAIGKALTIDEELSAIINSPDSKDDSELPVTEILTSEKKSVTDESIVAPVAKKKKTKKKTDKGV